MRDNMYDIGSLFLFRGLTDDERTQVLSRLSEVVEFEKGDVIYDSSHFRRAIGVFLCGRGAAGDRNATKASFSEGDVFGAAALYGAGENYVSRITARSACRVLFIPEDTLTAVMADFPVCGINYVTFLSERIRYLNKKIAQYTESSASMRLYRLLCDRADAGGKVENANISSLAALLGMGRTSAYRALAELTENGSIQRDNKTITILR